MCVIICLNSVQWNEGESALKNFRSGLQASRSILHDCWSSMLWLEWRLQSFHSFHGWKCHKVEEGCIPIFHHGRLLTELSYLTTICMRNKLILLVKPVRFGGPFICTYLKASSTETDVKVLVAQLCSTLCNPMDCSLPGLSVHGILQARMLEWVAISFSRRSFWPRDSIWVSCIVDSLPSEPPGKPSSTEEELILYIFAEDNAPEIYLVASVKETLLLYIHQNLFSVLPEHKSRHHFPAHEICV